jgi:hypothetical protein
MLGEGKPKTSVAHHQQEEGNRSRRSTSPVLAGRPFAHRPVAQPAASPTPTQHLDLSPLRLVVFSVPLPGAPAIVLRRRARPVQRSLSESSTRRPAALALRWAGMFLGRPGARSPEAPPPSGGQVDHLLQPCTVGPYGPTVLRACPGLTQAVALSGLARSLRCGPRPTVLGHRRSWAPPDSLPLAACLWHRERAGSRQCKDGGGGRLDRTGHQPSEPRIPLYQSE